MWIYLYVLSDILGNSGMGKTRKRVKTHSLTNRVEMKIGRLWSIHNQTSERDGARDRSVTAQL